MCRDYGPSQSECGIALSKVHLASGMLDLAAKELDAVLRADGAEREMLTHFKNRACDLPELVLEVFRQRAAQGQLTAGEAKYMLLMVSGMQNSRSTSPALTVH